MTILKKELQILFSYIYSKIFLKTVVRKNTIWSPNNNNIKQWQKIYLSLLLILKYFVKYEIINNLYYYNLGWNN